MRKRRAPVNPDRMPFLMYITLLHLVGWHSALEQAFDIGLGVFTILRMRDGLKIGRQQFHFGIAEQLTKGMVDLKPAPLFRNERHSNRRIVEGAAKALLAIPGRQPRVPVLLGQKSTAFV